MACIKSPNFTSLQEAVYRGAVASCSLHLWMPKDSPWSVMGTAAFLEQLMMPCASPCWNAATRQVNACEEQWDCALCIVCYSSATVRHLDTIITFLCSTCMTSTSSLFCHFREQDMFSGTESVMGACSWFLKVIRHLYLVLSWSSHAIENPWHFDPLPLIERRKSILLFMVDPIGIVLDEEYFKPIL